MINQEIARTKIVFHKEKFSKLVGFSAEEMVCFMGYNLCDGGPLFPLDKLSCCRSVINERADDLF